MRPRQIAGMLFLLLAVSLVGAVVYGKLDKSKPIHIDFVEKSLKEVNLGEAYILEVSWKNKDKHQSHEGAFVFVVEGKKFQVMANEFTFVFEGSVINPQEATNSLVFFLPQQNFPAKESGIVTVEVICHNSGDYSWQIRVTASP